MLQLQRQKEPPMGRRSFAALLASTAVALPLPGHSQHNTRPARIGVLTTAGTPGNDVFQAFSQKMRELGYVEGRTVLTDFRSAGGDLRRLDDLALQLVQAGVDIIITDGGLPPVQAARKATSTIPIVVATAPGALVSSGLVASFARPGGNITGFTLLSDGLASKRLELVREILPKAASVGVLWNPANSATNFAATREAAEAVGVALDSAQARNGADIPIALDRLLHPGNSALLLLPDGLFWNQRKMIVDRVASWARPAVYPEREYALAGGLLAYGPRVAENFRGAAIYVDRILKGARPEVLPVQQPTIFELIVNVRTARVLNLEMPPALLARAHEVIE